jgi:glycogen operon protein
MGNNQSGNNNAYCQDNKLTWLNWNLSEVDQQLLDFTSQVITLRHESRLFGSLALRDDCLSGCQNSDLVKWFHPDGYIMEDADWHAKNSQAIAVELRETKRTGEHWFLILNASSYQIGCKLPKLEKGLSWKLKLDTSCVTGVLFNNKVHLTEMVQVSGHSLILLKCVRHLN